MMDLHEAARVMGGAHQGENRVFSAVSTDSRMVHSSDLFFAIRGEYADGHDYLDEVTTRGAAGAVVCSPAPVDLPTIRVKDTTLALGRLGHSWRMRFDLPVVAITGSNGKTTVTALVASVLSLAGKCLYPEKSFNNQWGVPLTLLKLDKSHQFAVIEMGTNHPGEIEYLSGLAQPTVALINNIGEAHLEGLGTVDQIAKAKAEIYTGLRPDGTAVVNIDDAFHAEFENLLDENYPGVNKVGFGLESVGVVGASEVDYRTDGSAFNLRIGDALRAVRLPLPGRHNVMNALAAAAICHSLGVGIEVITRGLEIAAAVPGRLDSQRGIKGSTVIDDSYNANPVSIKAGIEVLSRCQGKKFLVLGHMAELGSGAAELHNQIGRAARDAGIDRLFALVPEEHDYARAYAEGFGDGATLFTDIGALIEALQDEMGEETTALVKGSRSSRMERVVAALTCSVMTDSEEVH